MKAKIFASLLLGGAMAVTSCNGVDSMLEVSDNISVSTLETRDTLKVAPADTVRFRFLVSTAAGAIANIDLEIDESVAEKVPEKTTFAGYDQDNELVMDENGNLSRDISTVIVEYPVVIRENPEVMRNTYRATLRATNRSGKVASNYAHFKGNNSKTYTSSLSMQSAWRPSATDLQFFNPVEYKAHKTTEFYSITGDEIEDADAVKNNIALAIAYNYFGNPMYYRIYSPDCENLETDLGVRGYPYAEMGKTRFFRIETPGDAELKEAIENETNMSKKNSLTLERRQNDMDYFDANINDDYLKTLDFSDASSTLLDVEGGLFAFQTHDGRRGVILLKHIMPSNNSPLTVTIYRCIFQVISVEPTE